MTPLRTATSPAGSPSSAERRQVAVVGGGFLGMRLADRLNQQGHAVTLIEAAPTLGGMADSWKLEIAPTTGEATAGGIEWDRHYHVILESDVSTLELLHQLDLGGSIRWGATRTGFFTGGRHISMSNSLEFLRFPPLNLLDKFRLAVTILYCSRIEDGHNLESVRVLEFLERWSGKRTTERVWRPLLRSKLGDDLDNVSAAFIWSTIRRMYAARRSGLKTERFGFVAGGYKTVNEAYRRHLQSSGVEILVGQPVQSVHQNFASTSARLRVELVSGRQLDYDCVVVTQPPALAARLCPELTRAESEALRQVTYRGVLCASILLRRPLRGFYVTNITDGEWPFTGVIEMTALVPADEMAGYSLVYLPRYLAPDDADFDLPDAEILERFIAALLLMYPELERSDVVTTRLSRVRRVTAVPTLDYSRKVPTMTTSVEGLFTVNSSQILNGTLNVNETLQLADRALLDIGAHLQSSNTLRDEISAASSGVRYG